MSTLLPVRSVRTAGYYAVVLLFSMLIAGYRFSGLLWNPVGFTAMTALAWTKPFVTRVLIPFIARYLHYVLDVDQLYSFAVLECLGIFLSVVAFQKYLKLFLLTDRLSKILSFSLLFVMPFELLLFRYCSIWQPYDVWALFFTIALLTLMYTQRFGLLLVVFIIGTLNRETTIVVTAIGMILYWNGRNGKSNAERRWHTKQFRNVLAIQAVVWVVLKFVLETMFSDRPGSMFQVQYLENWKFITDPGYLRRFSDPWIEMIFRFVFLLGNFGFLWVLVVGYRRSIRDFFLSGALLIVPFYFLGMLYVANLFEYRIFVELVPIIVAPAILILVRIVRHETAAVSEAGQTASASPARTAE